MIEQFLDGFSHFSDPLVGLGLVIGALLGYFIGALPGLGPTLGVALLIPFTYGIDPVVSIVALVALYVAAEYGGAITAIMINSPGTAAAVATSWDGYPMTKRGEAGKALNISIICSGIGITLSATFLALTAVPLSEFALTFGPTEYFALGLVGLSLVSSLSTQSPLKGAIAMCLGLALSTIGLDAQTGLPRFAFIPDLFEGLPLVPVLLGLYAISEVLMMIEGGFGDHAKSEPVKGLFAVPFATFWKMRFLILRSAVIGYVIGILPGAGASIGSFVSYAEAKRASKHPETFGRGNPEGIAASETANNAAVSGALAPLLALGIPGSPTTAILIGALMIQGIQPGPLLFSKNPEIPYTIFASLWVGVPIMVFIGLAGAKAWARVADVPRPIVAGVVAGVCVIGAYSSSNSLFPVGVTLIFGIVGYLLRKGGVPLAPIILALVLGDMMESNFRRALVISKGDWAVFLEHPISLVLVTLATLSFVAPRLPGIMGRIRGRRPGPAPGQGG
ncbi:MAG: tripartite tricarboxylate transporter permease [Rhodospirillum sp.]|nr:tripartite tricarboxylate transporter permease [Rhodospirillum sp.]MCF8488407.1 tripartite tricarboxylate transporter permease [Rhodospirillum sp.]MCF8501771.1 tripartite tricarboxylate transporter permease [Rhodospirillum sp.]